jgi:DnaJ-class molecular chaperone
MPKPGDPNNRGDLFARVQLRLPENMTEEEVNTLRSLAEKRGSSQPV